MATPEEGGIVFEFEDQAILVENILKGRAGQIGQVALQKPLSEATIDVKNPGETFDLEAAVKLDYRYFEPFDERRMDEIGEFVTEFVEKHQGSNQRQRLEDVPELVYSIHKLFKEERQDRGTRGLEVEFLETHADAFTHVRERGGIYTFTTASGSQLAIIEGRGYHASEIVITTGHKQVDPLDNVDSFMGRGDGPPRIIDGRPRTTPEEFERYFGDVSTTVNMLAKFLYVKHELALPYDVMRIHRRPKMDRHEEMMQELGQDSAEGKIQGMEVENPNVPLSAVGGNPEAKREIEGLAFALKNPGLYRKWGAKLPKGILLYGPPGTGKTLLARVLATESGARFLNVNITDVVSKWYGEAEKNLDEIFDYAAKQDDNTIIYFDEIDAIAPKRSGNPHEATTRTLSTLLVKMDGLIGNDNILVVGSTNEKDKLDPALLSRFTRDVQVPLPDEEVRSQIFQIHFGLAAERAGQPIAGEVDYQEIAHHSEGFSGRKLEQIVQITIEEKIRQEGSGETPRPIETDDVVAVIRALKSKEQTSARSFGFR